MCAISQYQDLTLHCYGFAHVYCTVEHTFSDMKQIKAIDFRLLLFQG